MERLNLEIEGNKFEIKIHFERRSNSRASIRRGSINIRIPSFLSSNERLQEIEKMKGWAVGKIKEQPKRFFVRPQRIYVDGERIRIRGEEFVLSLDYNGRKKSVGCIVGNTIKIQAPLDLSFEKQNIEVSRLVGKLIASKRIEMLRTKINTLNSMHFKRPIRSVSFKHLNSAWGIYSRKGDLKISTRLLLAPDDVLEYVCVHELAHTVEFNHSARFWCIVENVLPDYEEKEKWLRENGDTCIF